MEVVEFAAERTFAVRIHDGNMDMDGRVTFESPGSGRTRLTVTTDMPGLEDPEKVRFLRSMMQRSVDNVKAVLEAE